MAKAAQDRILKMLLAKGRFQTFLILTSYIWLLRMSMGCKEMYTNKPLDGYYCNGEYSTTDNNITQEMCSRVCLISENCTAMSYNPVDGTCLLASLPCVVALKHNEFMLMIFRKQKRVNCAVWVQDEAGFVPDRILTQGDSHVGRVSANAGFLAGSAQLPGQNWNTYVAQEGMWKEFPTEDLLTVHPNCTMAWLPYKARDTLPPNAVVTGGLANGRRLYNTLSFHAPENLWLIGTYYEGDAAAYYAYGGSNAVTQFDILVSV